MGVVELPGGPDDQLDVEYLLQVLQRDVSMPAISAGAVQLFMYHFYYLS